MHMDGTEGRDIIERVSQSRAYLVELLILAVTAGIAINLLSQYLALHISANLAGLLGATTIALCLGELCRRRLGSTSSCIQIRSIAILDQHNQLVSIPGYNLSNDVKRLLDAAFDENPALKSQWDKQPPSCCFNSAYQEAMLSGVFDMSTRAAGLRLLREAFEYALLNCLGLHLSSYFNDGRLGDVKELVREDMPQVLLKNRILELISRDTRDRVGFDEVGENVYSSYRGNRMYERINLALPAGSKVVRGGDNSVVIDSPAVRLKLDVRCDGYLTAIDSGFAEYYLGHPWNDLDYLQVDLSVEARAKIRLLALPRRRNYYNWISTFIPDVRKSMSFEAFLQSICWPQTSALVRVAQLLAQKPKPSPDVADSVTEQTVTRVVTRTGVDRGGQSGRSGVMGKRSRW